ncbi:L-arabinose ABC transporter [Campylobacter sp. RM13119]|uniref:L-arabinose ABC transporter n=1 Tax=Campylobacter TaxID=194 RepID=UPI0014749203|nr:MULTISPECIES: L-arabinose ABC transporter [unclassified Campylobacter]MBE3606393.1 L-arabinose ABC transporter [Campylobacter sp. RM13119]MBE3609480.1 L-arabinose ABC transporter [Campylobacter sp. RM12916]
MCCFGVRVFLLIFITVLSFVFHRLYPQIPVVAYYLLLANFLAFIIFSLFFRGALPNFVKPGAVHYFSLIGGSIGSFVSMAVFGKIRKDSFTLIELVIFVFWLILVTVVALNFIKISEFFYEFLI